MKFLSQILLIFSFSATIFCGVQKAGHVYQLTDETYDQFIKEHPAVFLKLYAPWCGHCKNLAPEFAQAAEMMAEIEDSKVAFAEADATVQTEMAEKLGIEGYPTIIFFHNNQKLEYDSDRTAGAMIQWITVSMLPKIKKIESQSELDEIYNNENNQVAIVYLGTAEGEVYGTFSILSNEIEQSGLVFIESDSEELIQYYNPKNKLIILKKFGEEKVELETDADTFKVQQFIRWNKVPMVMELSMSSADAIFTDQVPCLFLFLSGNETDAQKNQELENELKVAAETMFKKIYIAIARANEELTSKMLEFLGIIENQLPTVFIIKPSENNAIQKYKFESDVINTNTILQFFEQFQNDQIKPFYQSEEIPEQEYIDNVRQLVGNNFKQFMQTNKDKYLLVKFYAQWCPHCQKLKGIFTRLAGKLKEVNGKIILCEIEATLNEIEDQVIEGVPTVILFKPDGGKVEFNDSLKEKDLAEFLKKEMIDDWVDIEIDPETETEEEFEGQEEEEENEMDEQDENTEEIHEQETVKTEL